MILIKIFVKLSAFIAVDALIPNVYITLQNITETALFIQVFYKLYVYKGATISLNLDRYVDILVIDFYSREQKIIFNRKICLSDKSSGISINDFTMINEPGNNDTIESVIKFKLLKSFENIFSCWKQTDLIYYGKLYVTKMEEMKNSDVLGDIPKGLVIYSLIDAYFVICNSKDHDFESFCERDVDFCQNDNVAYLIVIFMIGGLIFFSNFAKLMVILISRTRRASNRVSPLTPTRYSFQQSRL